MKFKRLLTLSVCISFLLLCAVQAAAQVREIKIGFGPAGTFAYLPNYVAEGLGYFKDLEKEGLKVSLITFKGGAPAGLALLGGDLQFTNISFPHVVKAQEKGKDVKFLLTFFETQSMAMIAQSSLKDIKSPKDLKGKKIGITSLGSNTHMQARYILRHYGVDPKEVSFIPVGSQEAVGPWKQKMIDVLVHLDPLISIFIEDGSGKMLCDVRGLKQTKELYGSEYTTSGLWAYKEYIDKNPEVVQKIVNVYVKTLRWLATHSPEEVLKVLPKDFNWKAQWIQNNTSGLSPNGLVIKKGLETVIKDQKEDKLISPDFNVPVETLYDNRFVEKALKSM